MADRKKRGAVVIALMPLVISGCSSILGENKAICDIQPTIPSCSVAIKDARKDWEEWAKTMYWGTSASEPKGKIGNIETADNSLTARYKYFSTGAAIIDVAFELRLDPKGTSDISLNGKLCDSDNTIAISDNDSLRYHFVECLNVVNKSLPIDDKRRPSIWIEFAKTKIYANKSVLSEPIVLCMKGAPKCLKAEFVYYTH
jgi:hypothetical protein